MVELEAVDSVVAYARRADTPVTVRTLWAAREVKNVRHASRWYVYLPGSTSRRVPKPYTVSAPPSLCWWSLNGTGPNRTVYAISSVIARFSPHPVRPNANPWL